jgi:hypothetical protein
MLSHKRAALFAAGLAVLVLGPALAPAQTCPLPLADQRKAVEAFRALMPVFQHPRCANCHGALSAFTADTRHEGGVMAETKKMTDPFTGNVEIELRAPHPNEQRQICVECHDAAGGEWRQEERGQKQWAGQPAQEICRRFKFLDILGDPNSPTRLLTHFQTDPLVLQGFAGRSGGASLRNCPGDPGCMAVSHADFLAAAQAWLAAMQATGGSWQGDEDCGCKPPEVEESVVLVIDVSGSMNDEGKILAAQEAARRTITELLAGTPPKIEFGILPYSGSCSTEFPFTPFSQDVKGLSDVVGGLSAGGGTPMTPALYQARRRIWNDGYGKSGKIILLTDGANDCSGSPVEAAKRIFQRIEDDVPTQPRQGSLEPVRGFASLFLPGRAIAAQDPLAPAGSPAAGMAVAGAAPVDPRRMQMPVTVSTIGFHVSDEQQAVLDSVAAAGGGISLRAENAGQLAAAFQRAVGGGGTVVAPGGGGGGSTRSQRPGASAIALFLLGLTALALLVAIVVARSRRGAGAPPTPAWAPAPPRSSARPGQVIQLTIEVLAPGAPPRTVAFHKAPVSIGRSSDNDLVLDDPEVSRRHARVVVSDGGLWIEDAGSTGGMEVDGRRVERAELRRGARIGLGKSELRVL